MLILVQKLVKLAGNFFLCALLGVSQNDHL